MIVAVERMDVITVVRLLRSHPLTRHLTQTALAQLTGVSQATISGWETGDRKADPRRVVEALQGLGTPGRPWGMRWLLPADLTSDTEPEPSPSTSAMDAPRVIITAPGPIAVQVMESPPTANPPAVAFVADQDGPRLMVAEDSTWGVHSSPNGATAWFTLVAPGQPALTTHEPKDPR